jgi:hypothetical protein
LHSQFGITAWKFVGSLHETVFVEVEEGIGKFIGFAKVIDATLPVEVPAFGAGAGTVAVLGLCATVGGLCEVGPSCDEPGWMAPRKC